ncbi:Envoplakin [Merluccius polli]|uniref:Envoplakin n=1 Tax=Merluccius polli TaxID=89951 RepID=A0AA47MZN5_MERPO|nr:Envoplakin [Merluccius polli]
MSKTMEPSPVKITNPDSGPGLEQEEEGGQVGTQASDLTAVIARMQRNADQVEKNILHSEEMLQEDAERDGKGQPLIYQDQNTTSLGQAEGLLKDLFLDVDRARKLQHPQAGEIHKDVVNLHDRWVKDCSIYRDLYEQVNEVDRGPRLDWGQVLKGKQREIESEAYGPKLSDVEKQTAAHNILHEEIQAYKAQLDPNTILSREEYAAALDQYNKLLESSEVRRRSLSTLYDYMQSCNKELIYMFDQQQRILQQDWSDQMRDPAGVRMEYEKFKNSGLLAHETNSTHLQELGDGLVAKNHPGSPAILVHKEEVAAEWQSFLNLCVAQEKHLDNIEQYRKFQLDADSMADSLKRLHGNLDPKLSANKSTPEFLLALEADEPAVERNEQRLAALRELSTGVAPLKLRRVPPNRNTSALSLCDWMDQGDQMTRGEKLSLKSNLDDSKWVVQRSGGQTMTLPGACIMIPPPDTEAINRVDSLEQELTDLKRRRAALKTSLKSAEVDVVRPQRVLAVQSSPEDPKAALLAGQLDRIWEDLDRNEKKILNQLRSPLDRGNPTQDLATRLNEHETAGVGEGGRPEGDGAHSFPEAPGAHHRHAAHQTEEPLTISSTMATAAMFLEKQLHHVDGVVSAFEEQLSKDRPISDSPGALQEQSQRLQNMRKDLVSQQDDIFKLGRELELTQQSGSSLQKVFNEYCPDIHHQGAQVKQLRNRYTNLNDQLLERATLIQEANNKNQGFQSAVQSLNFFLVNLPNNNILATDDMAQINSKHNSQKRITVDIQRKAADLERVKELSHDLQSVLNEYDVKSNKFRGTLADDDVDDSEPKKLYRATMEDAVQKKERDLMNLYSEVSVDNNQLLSQMKMAKNIKTRNEEQVSQVVVKQQMQQQSQLKNLEEVDVLKKELNEEKERRTHAESNLETYRRRFVSLKSRRGVERIEEKEVVQYYRDPKLEAELQSLKKKVQEETAKRSGTRTEIEISNEMIFKLEKELTTIEPKLVTKVLTEYERDPQLDKEATRIRDEMHRMRMDLQIRDTEAVQIKTEITVLAQQKPKIRERVVKKEVIRLDKDPEMLKSVLIFQNEITDEGNRCQSLNDEIFSTRGQINTLERVIPTIQPKIVTKVIKEVRQDPDLVEEARKIRVALEEEKDENAILIKDLTTLQLRYSEVEKIRQKVEINEIINEIYRVDPETEMELVRLRKQLQDFSRNRTNMEKEITIMMTSLTTVRSQKPKIEYKEVTQELIKEEKSPEVVREHQRLNNQVSRILVNYNTTLDLLQRLRKERDELKVEKSKVEMKLVHKEVIKYENDPLLEKEADRLRRNYREEVKVRRSVEEAVFDLQNKYIVLERQKPEEKIVMQEMIRLERDPKQIVEHEKLNQTMDDEVKARRKLELEVRQLRSLVEEKEKILAETNDRQKKIQVEIELRQIRSRILELENAPPPIEEKIIIEEVLKVERDPKLEKLTDGLRENMETESNSISRLQRDIRNLKIKLDLLQKEKSIERVVYKEVVRVENDPKVEAERDHLRELVMQERNIRRDQEDKNASLNTKLIHLQTWRSTSSTEETSLALSRDTLQKEKDNLLRELKTLESERQNVSTTFHQQSKIMSERNQINRQRSLKVQTDVQQLERDILNEKDKLHQKETLILELQNSLMKEEHSDTHTRETNLSTRISILDPETGKDLSPYEAYVQGLIDKKQYIQLQELECDWEEIRSSGPDGESIILQDRKSGKQFSIQDALKDGRLTQYDLQCYKDGKMPISEFALLVAGETKKPYIPMAIPRSPTKATPPSPLYSMPSSLRSSYPNLTNEPVPTSPRSSYPTLNREKSRSLSTVLFTAGDELYPISGIYDTTTESRMSVRSALTRNLIDTDTALKLLEAQAASGGIVDLNKKDKLSVHKAAQVGLINTGHMHTLLHAQKAFTGVEDPETKERLSAGQAAAKGWIPQDSAMRYMQAQYLTGGLVDPSKTGRLTIEEAVATKMISKEAAEQLQDEASFPAELLDPVTKELITYKQAMDRCRKDTTTGLLLLPAISTEDNTPSYSNYRFSSSHSQV